MQVNISTTNAIADDDDVIDGARMESKSFEMT